MRFAAAISSTTMVLARLAKAAFAAAMALLFVTVFSVGSSHRGPCRVHGRGAVDCEAAVTPPADNSCTSAGRGGRICPARPL
jgi:hypothetical protein